MKILKKNKNLSKICHKLWSGLWSISKEKLWYNYSCFGNIWNTVYVFFAKEVCNQHFYYLKYICPRYMHEMDEGSRHHLIAFFLFSLSVLVMYSLRTLNRDVMSLEIVASIEILRRKVNFKQNELKIIMSLSSGHSWACQRYFWEIGEIIVSFTEVWQTLFDSCRKKKSNSIPKIWLIWFIE